MTRLAVRTLLARRLRTALTGFAIALGVGMIAAALTVGGSLGRGADSLSVAAYGGTDAVVTARTAFTATDVQARPRPVAAADLARIRALPGVREAVGDVAGSARVLDAGGDLVGMGPYFGVSHDPAARTAGLSPFRLQAGRWADGRDQVVLDEGTAAEQHLRVGDRVRIATGGPARAYRVTGVARFGEVRRLGTATLAIFDVRTAQALFGRGTGVDSVLVAAAPGTAPAALRAELARALPGLQVRTAAQQDRFQLDGLEQGVSIVRVVLLVFGIVALLVGAFTITNTLSITVAQRTRELALLRALGASRRQVRRAVTGEALLLGLGGSVAGLGAGVGLAAGVLALLAAIGLDLPRAPIALTGSTVAVALLTGTLVTLLASLLPARRAMRITPVQALRDGGAAREPGRLGRGLRAVVGFVAAPSSRLGGTAGRLARRNAMRAPGRTLATASALAIGVALVTAVAVVGHGLKASAIDTQRHRLTAPYVLTSQDGYSPVDAKAVQALRRAPGVTGVSAIRQEQAKAFGATAWVDGMDTRTIGSAMRLDLRAGSLDAVRGDGAVVRADVAAKRHLRLGSRFTVTTQAAGRVPLTVRAIMAKPRTDLLGMGSIVVDAPAFTRHFRTDGAKLTLVDAPAGEAAEDALRAAVAPFGDAELQTASSFVETNAAWIDQVLAVFYALLALAVVVSLFGIVNTLALAVVERTRELGMLRAVGMSRRQVRRMIRHESVATALLGAVTGIVAGLGLAAVATTALAQYGFAYAVPAGTLVAVVLVAIVAGVLAATLPARRAARLDPLAALATT